MITTKIEYSRTLFSKRDKLVRDIKEILIKTAPVNHKTYFLCRLEASGYSGNNQFKTNHIAGYRIRSLRKGEIGKRGRFLYDFDTYKTALEKFKELIKIAIPTFEELAIPVNNVDSRTIWREENARKT